MQVRTISYLAFAVILAAGAPAAAQTFDVVACPELPICGHCGADTKGAAAGSAVQTQPSAAAHDYFLKLDGVDGDSSKPPPKPKPNQTAPTIQSGEGKGDALTDGLMILRYMNTEDESAKAKPKGKSNGGTLTLQGSSAPAARPAQDGVVLLGGSPPATSAAPPRETTKKDKGDPLTDGLLIVRYMTGITGAKSASSPRDVTTKGQAVVPELPVCGHCGADVKKGGGQSQQSAASDYLRKLDRMEGESKPKPKPQQATTDGLMLIRAMNTPNAEAKPAPASDVTTKGQGVVPELPICAHCAADIKTSPPPKPKKRGGFTFSFGGVSLSSDGGVSVAVGDVNGDGRGAPRAPDARPVSRAEGRQ